MRALGRLGTMRARAESRMTSRATVWREDPENPVEVDGYTTASYAAQRTNLPGRLAAGRGAGQSRTITVGQTDIQLAVREWHCPAGTTGIRDGDLLEIIDGENAGLFLRVVEATFSDQATALRLPVVETQKPGGIT